MTTTNISYNLSNIPGFKDLINTLCVNSDYDKYYTIHPYSTKANENYHIIKYNKDFLAFDLIHSYGLLRSVILSHNKVVCFSSSKSISSDYFMKQYSYPNKNIVAEEFIEGTMINVFYDNNYGVNGCWQIATRNTVGAEVTFYQYSNKTFHSMFMETCL